MASRFWETLKGAITVMRVPVVMVGGTPAFLVIEYFIASVCGVLPVLGVKVRVPKVEPSGTVPLCFPVLTSVVVVMPGTSVKYI